MSAFVLPDRCIRCERKTKNLTMLTVMGKSKQKRVGASTTLTIDYSPTPYLCNSCRREFFEWINKSSRYIRYISKEKGGEK